jgi:superfamily II DNA or RNA helicase
MAPHAAALAQHAHTRHPPAPSPAETPSLMRVPLFVELFDTDTEAAQRQAIADVIQARVYKLSTEAWTMRADMVDLPREMFNYLYCEALLYLMATNRRDDLRDVLKNRDFSPAPLLYLQRGFALALPSIVASGSGLPPPTSQERLLHDNRVAAIAYMDRNALQPDKKLKPYQRLAIEWMLGREYGFLAFKPGLGKTLTMIGYHLVKGATGRAAVVADGAVAKQWEKDLTTGAYTRPPLPPTILIDTDTLRLHSVPEVQDPALRFLVTTKTFTDLDDVTGRRAAETTEMKDAIVASPWTTIVVDEAHRMLPKRGKQTLFAKNTTATRWLLSGTPIVNLGAGAEAARFYKNGFNREPGARTSDALHDFFVVNYGGLTAKLPGFTAVDVPITFGSYGEEAMYHALGTIRSTVVGATPSYLYLTDPRFVNPGILAQLRDRVSQLPDALRQWLTSVNPRTVLRQQGPRLRALRRVVDERVADQHYVDPDYVRHVFLLFSTRVSFDPSTSKDSWVEAVRVALGAPPGTFFYNNGAETLEAFKAAATGHTLPAHTPVFLFSTYVSGGAGLNLQVLPPAFRLSREQVVDTIVLLDLEWSPATTAQAIARALRLKQTEGRVAIYTLCFAERTEETDHRGSRRNLKELVATAFSRAPTAVDEEVDEEGGARRAGITPERLGAVLTRNQGEFLKLAGLPPTTNSPQEFISELNELIAAQQAPAVPPARF